MLVQIFLIIFAFKIIWTNSKYAFNVGISTYFASLHMGMQDNQRVWTPDQTNKHVQFFVQADGLDIRQKTSIRNYRCMQMIIAKYYTDLKNI